LNFARVIGTLWCTVKDESLEGMRFKVIRPEDERGEPLGEPIVAADAVSSRPGDRIFFVRAREAAKAFPGKFAPLDATILGIVDDVTVDGEASPPPPEEIE
jgi:ethanolamine utilization protein EutN